MIDFTSGAPPNWFSRMRVIQLKDYKLEYNGEAVGAFMVIAERASDKASFYVIVSIYGSDGMNKLSSESLCSYVNAKLAVAHLTLEKLSGGWEHNPVVAGNTGYDAEAAKSSIGNFDLNPSQMLSPEDSSEFSFIRPIVEKFCAEFRKVYGVE